MEEELYDLQAKNSGIATRTGSNDLIKQLLTIIPTILAGAYTFYLSRKKSIHQIEQDDVNSWRTLYVEMKMRAEKAENRADKLQLEVDKLRKKENENGFNSTT